MIMGQFALRVSHPIFTQTLKTQIFLTDDARTDTILSLCHLTPKVYSDSISADTTPTSGRKELIKLKLKIRMASATYIAQTFN